MELLEKLSKISRLCTDKWSGNQSKELRAPLSRDANTVSSFISEDWILNKTIYLQDEIISQVHFIFLSPGNGE